MTKRPAVKVIHTMVREYVPGRSLEFAQDIIEELESAGYAIVRMPTNKQPAAR